MAFELGFLVGSLALLGLVIYATRIRGPSLPHEQVAEGATGRGAESDPVEHAVETDDRCELCGENPATRSVNDLDVCADCDDDLLA
ncbi:hypothetical protein [Haloplanus halobius]|uniref:hypothetical protein n=1 Tax=Haloplanus halobius TaxID=2934938 RepID=UPI00200F9B09|nr:hypothetical protein [Haloplanus sp. XH21]